MSTDVANTTMITIFVNDQPRECGAGKALVSVLKELGFADRKGIAAALNGTVVARADWGTRQLTTGDRVILIQATQGG